MIHFLSRRDVNTPKMSMDQATISLFTIIIFSDPISLSLIFEISISLTFKLTLTNVKKHWCGSICSILLQPYVDHIDSVLLPRFPIQFVWTLSKPSHPSATTGGFHPHVSLCHGSMKNTMLLYSFYPVLWGRQRSE